MAKLRELANILFKVESKNKVLNNYGWSIFVRLIYPFVPHLSEELAFLVGLKGENGWTFGVFDTVIVWLLVELSINLFDWHVRSLVFVTAV